MRRLLTLLILGALLAGGAVADEAMNLADNPLLQEWDTPFGVPPFDEIRSEHYLPAFREAMRRHLEEIEAIATSSEAPNFGNTIEALERSGQDLANVSNVFYAVEAANTDDVIRETNRVVSPELARHADAIVLDPRLWQRVKTVYDQRDSYMFQGEQKRLLDETYKRFVRSGAALEGDARERLKEINAELASLMQEFGDNLLEETNDFALHVTDEADLGNLPASLKAAAAAEATRRGFDGGWAITLQRPSCNPFLEYSPNRAMRRQVFEGYAMRANRGNENDSNANLTRQAALRAERAKLLGYPTHAHYVLSDNMAETPDKVRALLDQVWEPAVRVAKEERAALQDMMQADGIDDTLKGWDWRYYSSKVRKARYDLDEEQTRPYFEFTAVRDGCFAVAERLFGVTLTERHDLPKWHPEQQVFEVREADGSHVGIVYLDFFARESKSGGAWMNELVMQHRDAQGRFVAPIVTTNFNFPPPTASGPSLLSFSESSTLFHEFGHALHGLFSNVTYGSMSGTNVPRDFVEFPSQVMENWFGEPETLRMFAKHVDTGEVIPDALIEKIKAASTFNQGFATCEYMAASYLDLAWHTLEHGDAVVDDAVAFEKAEMDRIGLIDEIIPRYRNTYFSHIFAGGYSSGYYSYLWSEVLDADAFAAFTAEGIFDPELAQRFRTLLSRGGTAPGMELYVDFRGREPEIAPLLQRRGLVEAGR